MSPALSLNTFLHILQMFWNWFGGEPCCLGRGCTTFIFLFNTKKQHGEQGPFSVHQKGLQHKSQSPVFKVELEAPKVQFQVERVAVAVGISGSYQRSFVDTAKSVVCSERDKDKGYNIFKVMHTFLIGLSLIIRFPI